MAIKDSVIELRLLCDELMRIDFGYPLGNNEVPLSSNSELPSAVLDRVPCGTCREQLTVLYTQCDGLSLPDVHVGYFLKSATRLASYDRSSEPDVLILNGARAVLPFGSTGGGSLFVIECQSGRVLLLPPGPLHDGQYDANGLDVRELAISIEQFIEKLTLDVKAFVKDIKHSYLF